eukprot:3909062-Pleurochrysis_carterae.AAC.2
MRHALRLDSKQSASAAATAAAIRALAHQFEHVRRNLGRSGRRPRRALKRTGQDGRECEGLKLK